jgi:RimJ/RimL family protein N-acetyltransferase/predicted SprT family Zn-dependent metalloprotease
MVNDPQGSRLTATTQTFSRSQIEAWLNSRPEQNNRCDWAILDAATGEFLGEVVLNDLKQKAEASSMNLRVALVSPDIYGRGFGTKALRLALTFAFETLKLKQVRLEVLVDNARAQAAYRRVGFQPKREFSEGKFRFLRMIVNKQDFVRAEAQTLLERHLDPRLWHFEFDSAKRRAGLCNYTERRITISRHLVDLHSIDESLQVMLHEIGHALAGKGAGHGPVWKSQAKAIGYRAEKFSGKQIAEKTAPWIGLCSQGHEHFRYRQPTRELSCGICGRGFSKKNLIRWQLRH